MTGQLPLAVAQLLIKRIPAFGATSHDNVTAVTLVLHPQTNSSLALGKQQDPIFTLGHVARSAPAPSLSQPSCSRLTRIQLFERALEVLREGYVVGRLLMHLFRWASGG